MSKYNTFITWLLYFTAIAFIWQAAMLQRDVKEFNRKMVWNIDATRQQYIEDVGFAFKNGCNTGTDYPPELRQSPDQFNQNSPVIWCLNKYTEDKEQYFLEQLPKLGRDPYK